jgi:hypothetical protein
MFGDPNPGEGSCSSCAVRPTHIKVLLPIRVNFHELLNYAEAVHWLNYAEAVHWQRLQPGAGIRVTRLNIRRYTLALSDTVPFGESCKQILS